MSAPLPAAPRRQLRLGVDVGGTNTDGVILDPSEASSPDRGILAWHKSPTTADPSDGIRSTLAAMLDSTAVDPSEVASLVIGTTHFVNAVVEKDAARLSRVAVIRLCGPFSKHVPPSIDWPEDLRELVLGHYALLKGGLQVDGIPIADMDEAEIRAQCAIIREKGIASVVVNGVFSPIDVVERQEERAADIIRQEMPDCDVLCSRDVANLGFLERENAAILNASILRFARHTIRSFQQPVKQLGLKCPVFITQNDGTILSGQEAARLPIRTFSSGPTNSMRGAAFLLQENLREPVMVVDIGGTTTDVGVLLTSGFPRQQAAYSDLGGVRMNFSCPDIRSIGLGGGSRVRISGESVSIGPDSVGYKLADESVCFGGQTLTATDCTVLLNKHTGLGDSKLVSGLLSDAAAQDFQTSIQTKLEKIIDIMKTSPSDLPVILVGGGAIIAPDKLKGASKVLKPRWSQVANAIGAATARMSSVVDTVKSTENTTVSEILDSICKEAVAKTVQAGAVENSVTVVDKESFPLPYVSNMTRFIVRAVGDFDYSRAQPELPEAEDNQVSDELQEKSGSQDAARKKRNNTEKEVDILGYRPRVQNRTWYISETDLDWISTGCYILGTGGGGSPYSAMIRLRSQLRNGSVVRVVNPEDLPDGAGVGCGGGAGSPTVGIEKLAADELVEAQTELFKVCSRPATHMMALEIGGGNGLQGMILGASDVMNLPTVDGDWMGRAYPTKQQTTPVVFSERSPVWSPLAMSDGNGNVVMMTRASSDADVDRVMRAALSQMGSSVGTADVPISGEETKRWVVEHTISQAWRIGRGVARARSEKRIDAVAEAILDECGGLTAGKVLCKGKIIGVERTLRMGHVYGECIIEPLAQDDDSAPATNESTNGSNDAPYTIRIPFKNENMAVIRADPGTSPSMERQQDVLAIVPDLITVIDAQSGEAVGTPEYRYGLVVVVLALAASDRWTSTARGRQIGGPQAFGLGHLEYIPCGTFVKPKSVIDEFDETA